MRSWALKIHNRWQKQALGVTIIKAHDPSNAAPPGPPMKNPALENNPKIIRSLEVGTPHSKYPLFVANDVDPRLTKGSAFTMEPQVFPKSTLEKVGVWSRGYFPNGR